jgi:hypothetical protein
MAAIRWFGGDFIVKMGKSIGQESLSERQPVRERYILPFLLPLFYCFLLTAEEAFEHSYSPEILEMIKQRGAGVFLFVLPIFYDTVIVVGSISIPVRFCILYHPVTFTTPAIPG